MVSFTEIDERGLRNAMETEGYAVLKGFLEPEVLEGAREELNVLIDGEARRLVAAGKIPHTFSEEPFEQRFKKVFETCLDEAPDSFRPQLHGPKLFDLFFHARLLDILQFFLGDEVRLYPNYTARAKLPEWERALVLWHQDGGYTAQGQDGAEVAKMRMVNVWIPLVPAREENGCMQFVPGTHKLGIVPHEKRAYYLEIAEDVLNEQLPKAVSIEVDPTDVVLFHNLLFHSGLPNKTDHVRWSMDWRYQDATQSTMRAQHGHLARSLAHGDEVVKSREDWAGRTFV